MFKAPSGICLRPRTRTSSCVSATSAGGTAPSRPHAEHDRRRRRCSCDISGGSLSRRRFAPKLSCRRLRAVLCVNTHAGSRTSPMFTSTACVCGVCYVMRYVCYLIRMLRMLSHAAYATSCATYATSYVSTPARPACECLFRCARVHEALSCILVYEA